MKELRRLLESTTVANLVRAKPQSRRELIALPAHAPLSSALGLFTLNDITVIPVFATDEDEQDDSTSSFESVSVSETGEHRLLGMLTVVDALRYLLLGAPDTFYEVNAEDILKHSIATVISALGGEPRRARFVKPTATLMDLLHREWFCNHTSKLDCDAGVDAYHLIVHGDDGHLSIITPSDFLRYILVNCEASDYLQESMFMQLDAIHSIIVKGEALSFVTADAEAWEAFQKLESLSHPSKRLLGILDEESGDLLAHITPHDFLPCDLTMLAEIVSLLRRPGISLLAYIRVAKATGVGRNAWTDIDPILMHNNYTLAGLIRKMVSGRVHHLWQVELGRGRQPVGVVGIIDLVCFLSKIFPKAD
jgi:CBS domain-containing protein